MSALVRYGGPDVDLVRLAWGDDAAYTLTLQGRIRWNGTRRRSSSDPRGPQSRRPHGLSPLLRRPPEQVRPRYRPLPPGSTCEQEAPAQHDAS